MFFEWLQRPSSLLGYVDDSKQQVHTDERTRGFTVTSLRWRSTLTSKYTNGGRRALTSKNQLLSAIIP